MVDFATRSRIWLDVARWAPSGDNLQPWKVVWSFQTDRIVAEVSLNQESRTPRFLEFEFRSLYVALGAFAQNLVLLLAAEGYRLLTIDANEEAEASEIAFHLVFVDLGTGPDAQSFSEISELIKRRTVSRYPFETRSIGHDVLDNLKKLSEKVPEIRVLLLNKERRALARQLMSLDVIRYEHAEIRQSFFDRMRFGKQNEIEGNGLNVKTFGVPAPVQWMLWSFKRFRGLYIFFSLGLQYIYAYLGCYRLIMRSGDLFAMRSDDDSPLGWFRLGMAMQDSWLELTRRGISVQPVGVSLLVYRYRKEALRNVFRFSPKQQMRLDRANRFFSEQYSIDLLKPCLVFRAGFGPRIQNLSSRRKPGVTPIKS
ncbi:MAG: hypothetical protein A2428_02220 [Bdellovibrionales bacterium RIFOXYC1_FULL_54_43]|nr:MAG: hypothetical protein A2428_02220 [Bdellovibrionales bacterium RIFOXYC1_FULL_54_43]